MIWEKIIDWFQQQTPRDQKVLKIGMIAVAIGMIYFLMIKPLYQQNTGLDKRIKKAETDLAWMIKNAPLFGSSTPRNSTNRNKPVNVVVTETARKFGLTLTRVQPKKDSSYGLWFDRASFDSLINWIQEIQLQGVEVTTIDLNKTENPGFVKATLTVSGG